MNLFGITAMCFPHAATNVALIAITHLIHTPYYTSAVNRAVKVGHRKDQGGVRGEADVGAIGGRTERYSEPFKSTQRDSGVTVFGLAGSHSCLPLTFTFSLAVPGAASH